MTLYTLVASLEVGLVYAILALGVYLSFRVLDFPDLTVDGSFPLGAAVSSVLIINEYDPFLAVIVASLAGLVSGSVTALLNIKLGIFNLLASIITMTALYSVNLRIMGRPNISLLGETTVFTPFEEFFSQSLPAYAVTPLVYAIFVVGVVLALNWFLRTELGLALRATGNNPVMARAMGINTDRLTVLGLALSNALVCMAGALLSQAQGSADIGMGTGTIIAGLVSVIVGEAFIRLNSIVVVTACVVVGSLIYRVAIGMALSLDTGDAWYSLHASDQNLITACLVVLFLAAPKLRRRGGLR